MLKAILGNRWGPLIPYVFNPNCDESHVSQPRYSLSFPTECLQTYPPPPKGTLHDKLATQGCRLRRRAGGTSEGWSGQAEGFSFCEVAGEGGQPRGRGAQAHYHTSVYKPGKGKSTDLRRNPQYPLGGCQHSIMAILLPSTTNHCTAQLLSEFFRNPRYEGSF